jgi:hypothetical protein
MVILKVSLAPFSLGRRMEFCRLMDDDSRPVAVNLKCTGLTQNFPVDPAF